LRRIAGKSSSLYILLERGSLFGSRLTCARFDHTITHFTRFIVVTNNYSLTFIIGSSGGTKLAIKKPKPAAAKPAAKPATKSAPAKKPTAAKAKKPAATTKKATTKKTAAPKKAAEPKPKKAAAPKKAAPKAKKPAAKKATAAVRFSP
jgi:hypothetical protein